MTCLAKIRHNFRHNFYNFKNSVMIKAQELRIGNKILSCFKNIETVRSVLGHQNAEEYHETYKHLICVKENGNQYSLGEINPIPLTSELLEKCGFGKKLFIELPKETVADWYISYDVRSGSIDRIYLQVDGEGNEPTYTYTLASVKYLHQLQNLYFALTGTELQVKL